MNDILTEREACAKIADNFQDSTWTATSHNYDRIVGYRDACKDISAAIRASPAPKPVITDEMVERAAKAIAESDPLVDWKEILRDSTKEQYRKRARAALVAALGGE